MAKILVYAYSKGIRSSRKIQELVECDVRYMWLAGGLKPDFHTIARFRKEKWREFSLLFADSVCLCKEAGLVSLDIVAAEYIVNTGHLNACLLRQPLAWAGFSCERIFVLHSVVERILFKMTHLYNPLFAFVVLQIADQISSLSQAGGSNPGFEESPPCE